MINQYQKGDNESITIEVKVPIVLGPNITLNNIRKKKLNEGQKLRLKSKKFQASKNPMVSIT